MLKADDYRRILAVLDEAGQATSLKAFRTRTLDALEEQMGYAHSAFLTRNNTDRRIDGIVHGQPQRRLNAYLQRWSDQEVLEGFSSSRSKSRSAASTTVYEAQLPVDVRSGRGGSAQTESMMAVWLHGGGETQGFLSLLSDPGDRFGAADRERLQALAPHLSHLLRCLPPEPVRGRTHPDLTAREAETVDLVSAGCSNREIARRLGVTESTVKKHVSSALTKLGVNSRTQLTLAWLSGKPASRSSRPARAAR